LLLKKKQSGFKRHQQVLFEQLKKELAGCKEESAQAILLLREAGLKATKADIKVFSYFCSFRNKTPLIFASQRYIAQQTELSRDTVIESIKKLSSWGWLSVSRNRFHTNHYTPHGLFLDPFIRYAFSRIVSAFSDFSLGLLLSVGLFCSPVSKSQPNPTLLSLNKNLYIRLQIRDRHTKHGWSILDPPDIKKLTKSQVKIKALEHIHNGAVLMTREPFDENKKELVSWMNPTERFLVQIEKYSLPCVGYASLKLRKDIASGIIYKYPHLQFFTYCKHYGDAKEEKPNYQRTNLLMAIYASSMEDPWFKKKLVPATNVNMSKMRNTALKRHKTLKEIVPLEFQHDKLPRIMPNLSLLAEKDKNKNPQKGNSYSHTEKPYESTINKRKREKDQHDSLLAILSYGDTIDKKGEMAKAILKSVDKNGEITNPFAKILAESLKNQYSEEI